MRTLHHFISLAVWSTFSVSTILSAIPARAEPATMGQIYALAKQGNAPQLKKLPIDTTGNNGRTALCQSIADKNYKAYHHLKSSGADTAHPCTEQFSKTELETFQDGYQNWLKSKGMVVSSGLSTGTMVGIGAGVAAVAGVAVAAGGGGGGGGGSGKSSAANQSSSAYSSSSSSSASTSSSSYSSGKPYVPLADHNLTEAENFAAGDPKYAKGRFLPAINAAKAYANTIPVKMEGGKIVSYDTGVLAEVRVAVMDTGIFTENQNINYATKEGQILKFDYAATEQSHGTRVAGIIAGKWDGNDYSINGVAPNARIVDWMIMKNGSTPANNKLTGFTVSNLNKVAATKPRIYNLSWTFLGYKNDFNKGYYWASTYDTVPTGQSNTNFNLIFNKSGSFFQKFLNNLADTQSVLVLASGNQGNQNDTQLLSAAPLVFNGKNGNKDLTNLMIVAVALDLKKGEITSAADIEGRSTYSNGCGVAAAYCLAAPAGNNMAGLSSTQLYSLGDTTDSDVEMFNGTSAATPVISGSLAFVMGAYPYLKSQDAVEILFRTANQSFNGWDDEENVKTEWKDSSGNTHIIGSIYGHGLVDLGAATEAIGPLSIPTSAGASSVGDLNAISKTPIQKTKLKLPQTLGGDLSLDLPRNIMGLDDYNRPFAVKTSGIILKAHHSDASFKRYFKSFMKHDLQTISNGENKMSFQFSSTDTNKHPLGLEKVDLEYALNHKNTLLFSYKADTLNRDFGGGIANPFIDMKNAYSIAERFKFNEKITLDFGTTLGKNGFYKGDEDIDDEYNGSVYAFTSGMDYQIYQDLNIRFIGGMIGEKEATLGINGSGAFETENSRTYFMGSMVEYKPVSKVSLKAAYYYGRTETPKGDGLIGIGDLISDGFAFDAQYDIDQGKLAGIQLTSPLKIKKGKANLCLPYARDMYSDTVYYNNINLNLKPEAREYDIGIYYQNETSRYLWRGEFMTRFNPEHRAHVKPDYRAIWGLDWKF